MKHMNVLIGQSGGPTAVINASLAGVISGSIDAGANRIYGMVHGIQGFLDGRITDLGAHFKNEQDLELLKRTPSSFLGSCRYSLPSPEKDEGLYEHLFSLLKRLDITDFFYIGGNDSMDTIFKLNRYGRALGSPIRFIGVPKTIDNDLAVTDHCPGYGSAAKFVASTCKELIRDLLVYERDEVTVLEIMGRDAGWLTAACSLAKGPDCEGLDLICLPETPFDLDAFTEKVACLKESKKSVTIAVSEGIRDAQGKYMSAMDATVDAFGHQKLRGTAAFLSTHLGSKLGIRSKSIEFSSIQRCAAHMSSLCDVNEAFLAGATAVEAAEDGKSGMMVSFTRKSDEPYVCVAELIDVAEVANKVKHFPAEWITEDGVGSQFNAYALPLIQGELPPIMDHGLPRHLVRSVSEELHLPM